MTTVAPKLVLILLAAGRSQRFGSANKLLVDIGGETLVHRVARTLKAGLPGAPLIVVTGHDADRIRETVADLADMFAHNDQARDGIATSIRAGLAATSGDVDGALIAQADMPNLDTNLIADLAARFAQSGGTAIVHPMTTAGRQGTPVIWPRDLFGALSELQGDQGAKPVIASNRERVRTVAVADEALVDLDTEAALKSWRTSARPA